MKLKFLFILVYFFITQKNAKNMIMARILLTLKLSKVEAIHGNRADFHSEKDFNLNFTLIETLL